MTMAATNLKTLLIGLVMLLAAGLALALTPRTKMADQGPKVDLEAMIPTQFGDWHMDESLVPLMPDPTQQAVLNKIYNQTLSRTYINGKGQRIMLSLAYGGDQSDGMQVHKPEVCYPSQGFYVQNLVRGMLDTGFNIVPVNRLVAVQGNRVEPITYWIIIGDKVARGSGWKLEQIKYGLTGRIPDGLLFRVSNISTGKQESFGEHEAFIRALLQSLGSNQRERLVGASAVERNAQ